MELDKADIELLIGLVQGRINAVRRSHRQLDGAERSRLVKEYETVLHKLMQVEMIRDPLVNTVRALERLLEESKDVLPETNKYWNEAYDAYQYALGFAGIDPNYEI